MIETIVKIPIILIIGLIICNWIFLILFVGVIYFMYNSSGHLFYQLDLAAEPHPKVVRQWKKRMGWLLCLWCPSEEEKESCKAIGGNYNRRCKAN